MTDSASESIANGDHAIIQVRVEGERCEREISHVCKQTLGGKKNNEDELLASVIKTKLPQKSPDDTCIFRVPSKLIRDNENAFVPQVVSIGPNHHGGKKLQAMEKIKLWNLQRLLDRKATPDTSLMKFVKEIRSREEFLRNCYDEKFDHLSSDQFVEMMVVDGCFIIEIICVLHLAGLRFIKTEDYSKYIMLEAHDPFLSLPGMLTTVLTDLLLLENQLPWEVLDCLFNLTTRSGEISLYERTCSFFYFTMHNPTETWQIRHLLDNTRNLFVGSSPRNEDCCYADWTPIPSVTHLEEIGVKFQRAFGEIHLSDITFNLIDGVMEIPLMTIGANSESLIRNLIAYEQRALRHSECHILSYAMLFNQLVKSTKDLDSLIQKEIIETDLSKEDTLSLCNRVCNDIEPLFFSYSKLARDVNMYYKGRQFRRWLARINRDYLYNPSSIWSVSNAVIIVLILTVTQTVYSVLAYYKQ